MRKNYWESLSFNEPFDDLPISIIPDESGIIVDHGGKCRTDVMAVVGADGEAAGAGAVVVVAAIRAVRTTVFTKT